MNFKKSGYNILLEGRPDNAVKVLPEPKILYLPLKSDRFSFDDICVTDGQHVNVGDALARDSNNYFVPLLAPREGTVDLKTTPGHIVLTSVLPLDKKGHVPEKDQLHITQKVGEISSKRQKLLDFGAWQFFYDAYTGQVPNPSEAPQAVIVSTVSLEPYVVRGDVQLRNRLLQFTRGLEHIQSLLEYQSIYLIMPDVKSSFASQVKEHIRGYAWIKLIEIPRKYPNDNFTILARQLGLKKKAGPIWSLHTEGVLAVDRVLTLSEPSIVRAVSIGGPCVKNPTHLKAMIGYPVQTILDSYASEPDSRVINGGMLTGKARTSKMLGLDSECRGLTVIPEHKEREFLGFLRPGWSRRSYSKCFLSAVRSDFAESLSTAVRGEERPCVSCNYCDEICPAHIIPHLIHKYLYSGLLEDAERARLDLCIECGLCSYVCPSKIKLTEQFIEAKELLQKEKEEILAEEAQKQEETIDQ